MEEQNRIKEEQIRLEEHQKQLEEQNRMEEQNRLEEQSRLIKYMNPKNDLLIVVDNYNKCSFKKHTNLLKDEFNCDIAFFGESIIKGHKKFTEIDLNKYSKIIFQNTFFNLPQKCHNQKYIYIVHSQCDQWNNTCIDIIINNDFLIDKYIFVSESVKQNFETNVLNPKKSYIVENNIKKIISNKKENPFLFVSCGSYQQLKGHDKLIWQFSKFEKKYKLEIYGDVRDKVYFENLNKIIEDNNFSNIKLFNYTDEYIERLKEASYFILFSESEGCSYAMLEAISLNKKIVCTEKCLTSQTYWYPNKYIYKEKDYNVNWFQIDKTDYLPYSYNHFIDAYSNILFPVNKIKIGNIRVNKIDNVLNEMKEHTKCVEKNGYSALLRIKNEEDTIEKCILDIIDLVDEIIVVDNGSTDNTLNVIKKLEKMYNNVYVYQYNISIPRYGKEHIDNFKRDDINKNNTLKNFYNWVVSKSTYNKKIKWDGDFYCIRNNLKNLLDYFSSEKEQLAVHFSGLTVFVHKDKKYIKNSSYYNEYRLFCNKNDDIWYDNICEGDNYCETSDIFQKKIINKYISTIPCFYEIKMTSKNEFNSRSSNINDGRDNIDLQILNGLVQENSFDENVINHYDNIYASSNKYYFSTDNFDNNLNKLKKIKYISSAEYVNLFNTNNQWVRKHVFKHKKKFLLVIDSYGWAFDNIVTQIKKYYDNTDVIIYIETYPELWDKIYKNKGINEWFDYTFYRRSEVTTIYGYTNINIYDNFEKVIIFWYGDNTNYILDYFKNKKTKTFLAIYDYSKWINNENKEEENIFKNKIDYFIKNIDGYFYGCPIIKKLVNKNYSNNKLLSYPCFDGVDSKLFYNQNYDVNIYTKNKIVIGWIGNSNPCAHGINKGFNIIENIIAELPDKFIFLPQDIHTMSYVNHNDLPEYFKKIDIIVCFSNYEGTPNQILECSSSGKCWISTDVGIVEQLNNTIDNNACGIIIKRTNQNLKDALMHLYNNRNLIVEYGNNGRKAIENSWDWNNKVKQFTF